MNLFENFNSGTTSAFDFKDTMSSAYSAGTESGGFDAGSAANTALDAAASAIPFGAFAKDLLDQIGLSENIDLVSKYGFSSWGASTSPEEAKQQFADKILTYIQGTLSRMTAQNAESILNELETTLLLQKYFKQKLLQHHSKAKSTKLANEWWIEELGKIHKETMTKAVAQLRSIGVTVKSTAVTYSADQLHIQDITDEQMNDYITNGDVLSNSLAFKRYTLDFSTVKEIEVDQETGKIKKKSSSIGLFGLLGGLAYAVKSGAIKI